MLEKRPARVPIQTGEVCWLAWATSTAAALPARDAIAEYKITRVGILEVSGAPPMRGKIVLRTSPAMIVAKKPATIPKYKLCWKNGPSTQPAWRLRLFPQVG